MSSYATFYCNIDVLDGERCDRIVTWPGVNKHLASEAPRQGVGNVCLEHGRGRSVESRLLRD
jgi:hypothetical protein